MSIFHVYSISNSVFEQNRLTQSITLDIILDRNNVIFKRWHYAETYKTDKSIFEYESNRDRRTLNVTFQTVNRWENGRAVPNKLAQSKMFDFCKEKHVPVYDMTLKRIAEESKAIKLNADRVLLYHGSKSGIEGPIEP